ncbi:hypothetical protein WJX72_007847 [[Myrmecia] bisecta]|uniref:Uncharacterized protein n=1 Tax=[Myrmecia] bisecta TaxID=41462 RepID=A0AAW1PGN6_9CHLO
MPRRPASCLIQRQAQRCLLSTIASRGPSYLDALAANKTSPEAKILQLTAKKDNVTNEFVYSEHGLSHVLGLLAQRYNQSMSASTNAVPTKELTAEQLLAAYGSPTNLTAAGVTNATLAILACQVDSTCMMVGTAPHSSTPATTSGDAVDSASSVGWLKWTSGAVLFVEALLGVFIPILMRMRLSLVNASFLSLLNCFTGGVFLAFGLMHLAPGVMHLAPDAAASATYLNVDYPIAYLFIMAGFYLVFMLQKLAAPLLAVRTSADLDDAAGLPGGCCQPPILSAESEYTKMDAGLKQPVQPPSESGSSDLALTNTGGVKAWRQWISPSLLFLAFCCHGILEGLALGLQTDKAGIVTILIALVAHKWVESIALATRCTKIGAKIWQILTCLIPFALVVPIGIGIGAAIAHDINPWIETVLFGLVAGCFIYVGAYEIVHEEFAGPAVEHKLWRCAQFVCLFLGFTLVALLQLIHD